MAGQTSSNHIDPHSAFSDLLDLLLKIPHAASVQDRCNKCEKELEELKQDVMYIQKSLGKLSKFEEDLGIHLRKGEGANIKELARAVQQLKNQLPSASYYQFPKGDGEDNCSSSDLMMSREYNSLTLEQKKCLWCFLVFPENAEIKKRVLINWWIGEGLIQGGAPTEPLERVGEVLLGLLQRKRFIKQVEKKKRGSDSWTMEPSARSFVSTEAEADVKVLLASAGQAGGLLAMGNPVTTVFNINKPAISESEAQILASMEGLEVLHLGRSQIGLNNIQVKNLKLITEGLNKMKRLRLLSFQGISSLGGQLPRSVCGLRSLIVLDLRACQALESLPRNMGSLTSLRHLDLSGCHRLLRMPLVISRLPNLEVLKGFVIAGRHPVFFCILHYLSSLKKLYKLSIFVSRKNFPESRELKALANIKGLVKLKIVWNPTVPSDEDGPGNAYHPTQVLRKLEKLSLWCTPKHAALKLLTPTMFPRLNKLYLRGSDHITHIGHTPTESEAEEHKWNVRMLRLCFLRNLKMSWEELHRLFPKLSYLEVQDCRKLQFISQYCDEEGVW